MFPSVCGVNVDSKAYYFQTDSSGTPTRGEESGKFLKTGEQMGSYHSVGDKGQNEGEKSISLLPSLGQEADGRFDSNVLSRAVTLEQAFLPSWQQLCFGVWKLIGQEFQAPGGCVVFPCGYAGESVSSLGPMSHGQLMIKKTEAYEMVMGNFFKEGRRG